MARRSKKGRPINGVVLVNKHQGESSNRVLQQVKRLYNAQKAGHTGALDPLATGMLPVCLGEATKFSQFLLDADKVYQVRAQLGVRTDTSDADGTVVETRPVDVSDQQLAAALEQFRGDIEQVPSMFSALKHQGKPLYEYARQGITIDRPARPIQIFRLELLQRNDDFIELDVHCSKGTYIRSLVDDLGQLLGCGAHVQALHRSAVADYPAEAMLSVDELAELAAANEADTPDYTALDAQLLPLDSPVARLPVILAALEQGNAFLHGQPVSADVYPAGTPVRVENEHGVFLGVAEYREDKRAWPKRVVVFDT
ncbi:tRNA pseudouridine(55) synthase TruB [Aliidiomarina sedimenti]|uniref:tRNA pseudouridine synthase B n=1 Tax=Aliidiomarina sedimenti TaxID=1933879 RepID=A0ABY0C325_9GAMM|nr:tRNA pseudouridine(55) synthase TruB [Aliidiomarina sedimenti]RUO32165.1 tRNA pseudouridine(55) synthase TruB [Aliidiomarina sedimenti]